MPTPSETYAVDLEQCRALLRRGSKSFSLASLLLPKRVRDPAAAIYAFCRVSDDLIDEGGDPEAALHELHARLDAIYRERPEDDPVDRALCVVVREHGIPKEIFAALLEGFAWDASRRTYEGIEDVQAYSARVAGTVGVMMTLLMGPRDEVTLARACDLGVAMQLTNIARDVGEDARRGRVYLPAAWLRDVGVRPEAFLADPVFRPEVGEVVRRLLVRARELYDRSDAGIAMLPSDCQVAIRAARFIYAEIGEKLERDGMDSISRRTVVGRWRKLWLVARAVFGRAAGEDRALLPEGRIEPLDETRFLVRASAQSSHLMLGQAGS